MCDCSVLATILWQVQVSHDTRCMVTIEIDSIFNLVEKKGTTVKTQKADKNE